MTIQQTLKRTAIAGTVAVALMVNFSQIALASGTLASENMASENMGNETPHHSFMSHSAINYRHMSLYDLKQQNDLKQQKYSDPSSPPRVNYWGGTYILGKDTESQSSFSSRVSTTLWSAGYLALTLAALYGIAQTVQVFNPYAGAISIMAIELPKDASWRITGCKTSAGRIIRSHDFIKDESTRATTEEYGMFDSRKNPVGRFLLIDQENWWGLADYPIDADVTFTHYDENGAATGKEIIVNYRRKVTNLLKAGAIKSKITSIKNHKYLNGDPEVKTSGQVLSSPCNYKLAKTKPFYPDWTEFSRWYHEPTRVLVEFQESLFF